MGIDRGWVLGVLFTLGTGAVLAGEPAAKGPLADRPSKPGAHLEKLKALGTNAWLNLGKPAPDPKYGAAQGRTWSRKMAYAPDLRGAFIFGSGIHHGITERGGRRYFNDDLFFYDINAHAWICAHPGTPLCPEKSTDRKGVPDPSIRLDPVTGLNVDGAGNVVPVATSVHAYWTPEYDIKRRLFVFMPSTDPFGLPQSSNAWSAEYSPYYYDGRAGRFTRSKTATPSVPPACDTAVFYSSALARVLYFNRGVWIYDHDANTWRKVNDQGGGNGAYCHDPKRDWVYFVSARYKQDAGRWVQVGDNRLSVYDIKANKWSDPDTTGTAGKGMESNNAFFTYDTANDVAVLHIGNEHRVYDPDKREWRALPKTMPEQTADWHRWGGWGGGSGFYDPELNVHFYFNAWDSQTGPGNMWAWRYGQAGRGN